MDYKTILVHLDDAQQAPDRIGFAAGLAKAHGAHLIGMAQTGISKFIREAMQPGVELGDLTPLFEDLRQAAGKCAAGFDTIVRQAGVPSFAHRIDDEEPGLALALQGLYADLVIVGRAVHTPPGIAGVPEYVAMNSPSPVLVLPDAGATGAGFERIMVARNASPESARAVRLSMPLLVRARHVDLAIFDEEGSSARSPDDARAMAQFLARHGVDAEICRHQARREVGNALLVLAEDRKTDLLVMGCYGHSRYREILLGGVSRTVLRRLPVPVLIAH